MKFNRLSLLRYLIFMPLFLPISILNGAMEGLSNLCKVAYRDIFPDEDFPSI